MVNLNGAPPQQNKYLSTHWFAMAGNLQQKPSFLASPKTDPTNILDGV